MKSNPISQGPKNSGRRREVLGFLAQFSYTRYRLVLLLIFLSFGASLLIASRLQIKTDIFELLPQDNEKVNTFREVLRDYGSMDYLLIALESRKGGPADEFEDFADFFAKELRSSPLIDYVEYKIWEESENMRPLLDNGLLYLSPPEIDALADRLRDEKIREQVTRSKALLLTPSALPLKTLVEKDPFNILPLIKDRLLKRGGNLRLYPFDGYYLCEDRSMLLMIARPIKPAQDLAFGKELMRMAHAAEQRARQEVEKAKGSSLSHMNVSYGGGYLIALHDSGIIQKDILRNFLTSFCGVLLLFLIAFRTLKSLFFAGLPLAVGIAWTMAFAALSVGELNFATSGFSALLLGLAIDFTIVLYNRYLEERIAGQEALPSARLMLAETGQPVFTGAVTTAAAFYAMMITKFRGLSELGLLTGTGILFCLLATYIMLPALCAWDENRKGARLPPRMRSFGLERIFSLLSRFPRGVVWVSLGCSVLLGFFAFSLTFDDDITNIRPKHNEALILQEKIAEKFGLSYYHFVAVAERKTVEEALIANEQIAGVLRSWSGKEGITGFDSVETFLPSQASQEERLAYIQSKQASELNGDRIARTFQKALRENGFRPSAYDEYLKTFRKFLSPSRLITWEEVRKSSLGRILGRYLKVDERGVRVATYVYQDRKAWREGPPAELLAKLASLGSVKCSGVNILSRELKTRVYGDAKLATLLALLGIGLLLYLDFRSIKLSLLALIPLGFGILWMFGLMDAFGMKLNLMNIFAVIMILGIGVDYGVHVLHRYYEDGGFDVVPALNQVGKAVLMAALTTIFGFGTITFSDYPGLISMGVACVLGVGTCAVVSLILLPAVLFLWGRPSSGKRKDIV
jgi:predicted RND superfamily exporter protein